MMSLEACRLEGMDIGGLWRDTSGFETTTDPGGERE